MSVIQLNSCSGMYCVTPQMKQVIRFKWNVPRGNRVEKICVTPAVYRDGRERPDMEQTRRYPVSKAYEGGEFALGSSILDKLTYQTYYVYAVDASDCRNEEELDGIAPVKVLVGNAVIEWSKQVVRSNDWTECRLSIKSSSHIMAGLVGYKYDYCGVSFKFPVPQDIVKGENQFPAVFIPQNASEAELVIMAFGAGASLRVERTGTKSVLERILEKFKNG